LVFVGEFWRYKNRWHSNVLDIQKQYMDIIVDMLPKNMNIEIIGPLIFWVGATMSLDWQTFRPMYSKKRLVQEITDVLFKGIL
jgi:hypothetical protein